MKHWGSSAPVCWTIRAPVWRKEGQLREEGECHMSRIMFVVDLEKDLKVLSQTNSSFFFFFFFLVPLWPWSRRFKAQNLSHKTKNKTKQFSAKRKIFHLVLLTSIKLSLKTRGEAQEATCYFTIWFTIHESVLCTIRKVKGQKMCI